MKASVGHDGPESCRAKQVEDVWAFDKLEITVLLSRLILMKFWENRKAHEKKNVFASNHVHKTRIWVPCYGGAQKKGELKLSGATVDSDKSCGFPHLEPFGLAIPPSPSHVPCKS